MGEAYSCEIGGVVNGGLVTFPLFIVNGKYRTDQDNLFLDVPRTTVTNQGAGSFYQVAAKASVADPKSAYGLGTFGPTYTHVDMESDWRWVNPGGDWINTAGTQQGVTLPYFAISANSVTSGSGSYTADITDGVQKAYSTGAWNAYIIKLTGGARSLATHHHPTLAAPSISVQYADGSSGTLRCVACTQLTNGTSYAQTGAHVAPISPSLAIEFSRPAKAVASATLNLTIADHSATAASVSGYFATPPLNANPVLSGVAASYAYDAGITANTNVFFAHQYQDGSVRSDWFVPGTSINVFDTNNWSPHLFGLGNADSTKLPTAIAGNSAQGKWIAKQTNIPVDLVSSAYVGEGFEPIATGIGALKVTIPATSAVDGGVDGYTGSLGSDLWMLLPESDIGLLDRLFVRYYMRLGDYTATKITDKKMLRNALGSTAYYALAGGKIGIGQHHWSHYGGNNNIGGGNGGWTNRLTFNEHPLDAGAGGVAIGQHAWDMLGVNFPYGSEGGFGGSLYPGYWYCVEIDLKLNTIDMAGVNNLSDAELNVYIDGRLVTHRAGFSYRKGPLDYTPGVSSFDSATRMFTHTDPANGLPPFRQIGHMGIAMNDFQGGTLSTDHDRTLFYTGLVVAKSYVGPMAFSDPVASWRPAAGTIANISLNTRIDVDPKFDALANPNGAGNTPPWEQGSSWIHMTDYCGAIMASDVGLHGTYMQYGAAGHSSVGACFWIGFDLADRTWKRVGKRPLPSDCFQQAIPNPFSVGTYYPAEQLDPTWGEWQGGWGGWPSGFAQAGYNPPEGAHTRNSFTYRPSSKAGNAHGQILTFWQPTGKTSGTGIRGGHIWDADTGNFSRQSTLRPGGGSAVGGMAYVESIDVVVGLNMESSGFASAVDVFDCSSMASVRRTVSNAPSVFYDSTSFAHPVGNLYVICNHKLAANAVPAEFWAIDAAALKAGTAASWSQLAVSASSWPVGGAGITSTVGWSLCPVNGCYYAVNRVDGSNKLWKLTPPTGTSKESQLSGAWVISEETLGGSTLDGRLAGGGSGTSFDYNRLQWSDYGQCFIWTPDYVGGNVQAIRPVGI